MKVEYRGGISFTNTKSISSILPSPSFILNTPLFTIRVLSSVFLLMLMVSVCSLSFSELSFDVESEDECVPLVWLMMEGRFDMSTSHVISIIPVGWMDTLSGSVLSDVDDEMDEWSWEEENDDDDEEEEEEESSESKRKRYSDWFNGVRVVMNSSTQYLACFSSSSVWLSIVSFQFSFNLFKNCVPSTHRMYKFFSCRLSATLPSGVGPILHPVNFTFFIENAQYRWDWESFLCSWRYWR